MRIDPQALVGVFMRVHIEVLYHSMRIRFLGLFLTAFAVTSGFSLATDNTYVRFETVLGNIDVQMLTDEAPNTVANFMTYVNSGAYNATLIHRAIPSFVIQGGTYSLSGNSINFITANAPIASEAGNSNHASSLQGTLSMALLSGEGIDSPDSATDGWFFNLVDNTFLDTAQSNTATDGTTYLSGPFTVFGRVANASSLAVMQALGNLSTFDFSSLLESGAFTNMPVINYTSADYAYYSSNGTTGSPLSIDNLTLVNAIVPLQVQHFSDWQTANFSQAQLNDPTQSGPTVSAFPSDGVPNLLKYLCNIKPGTPITAAERGNLPALTVSGGFLLLKFHENPALLDMTVNVQTSPDLQTWTKVTSPTIVQIGTDSNNNYIMQVEVPQSGTQQYIQLNLTQP